MKIYLYEVFIPKDQVYESKFDSSELEVAVQNEELIVINDRRFTIINKAARLGSSLNRTLNDFHVSEWKLGCKSLDGIHYTEYSDHPVRAKTIKSRIERFIEREYSWTKSFSLDFIKESK